MTNRMNVKKRPKLDPVKFTDEDLFDSLPNDTNQSATLAEVCQSLCHRIMHDTSREEDSRRIEQIVRRRLFSLGENYPNLVEIRVCKKICVSGILPNSLEGIKNANYRPITGSAVS